MLSLFWHIGTAGEASAKELLLGGGLWVFLLQFRRAGFVALDELWEALEDHVTWRPAPGCCVAGVLSLLYAAPPPAY